MSDDICYYLDDGFACGGIVVHDGVVVDSAPIWRWMWGKSIDEVSSWKRLERFERIR